MRASLSSSVSQVCKDIRMVGAGAQLRRFPKAPGIKQRLIGSSVAVVLVIVALVVALVAFGAMAVARHD